jgi:hypothetical protein
MVERFQLSLLLTIIALRNLIEVSGSTFSTLPASYISISIIPSFTVINRIFTPALIVLFSEVAVDWLKHAFITKFNHIRPEVYGRFIDVLCRDLIPTQDSRYVRALLTPRPSELATALCRQFTSSFPSNRIRSYAIGLSCSPGRLSNLRHDDRLYAHRRMRTDFSSSNWKRLACGWRTAWPRVAS